MSDQEQETAKVYTPSTENVRSAYGYANEKYDGSVDKESFAEFNRWLVSHDRVVAAKALEDAAEHITDDYIKRAILARASALRVQGDAE